MTRETRKAMKAIKQRVVDFFFIYFDSKTSRTIDRHPEIAVSMIREAIADGIPTRSRLTIYAAALRDALEYQRLVLADDAKAAV